MHFFIDPTNLSNQTSAEKYGPVDGFETTKYNVTSMFSSNSDGVAFACEDCKMIVQQSTADSALVNLILEPTSRGSIVKYYIYRGISKLTLIDSNNIIPIGSNNSELVNRINNSLAGVTSYEAVILGYDNNSLNGTTHVDNIFFNSTSTLKPIDVKEGESIGEFVTGSIGFEIILETDKINIDLDYVRKHHHTIDVASLTGLALRSKREEILAYVDPVAFFALYNSNGVSVSSYSGQNKVTTLKKGIELYTYILSKFYTKDILYLDIRSDKGYYYNYYQEYNDGADKNIFISSNLQDYQSDGWPIIIKTSVSDLNFKLRTNGNVNPILFIKQKELNKLNPKSFYLDNLIDEAFPGWTKTISIDVPIQSYYIKLYYFHQIIDQNSPNPFIKSNRYYDHAICSLDLLPESFNTDSNKLVENSHPVYIREKIQQNGFGGFGYFATNGAFWDNSRMLFYSNLLVQKDSSNRKFSKAVNSGELGLENEKYTSKIGKYLQTNVRLYNNNLEPGSHEEDIKIISISNCEINSIKEEESCIFLGLTIAETQAIKNASAGLSENHQRYIYLEPYTSAPTPFTDSTNIIIYVYQYSVRVQGLDSAGNLAYNTPNKPGSTSEPIIVYSLDRFFYNSKAFSENETVTLTTNQVEFHIYHNKREVFQIGVIKSGTQGGKIKYIYHHENGIEYPICECELIQIDGVSNGKKRPYKGAPLYASVPPNGTKKDGLADENTSYDFYYYSNKDIWVTKNDGSKIRKYTYSGKKIFMVRFNPNLFQEVRIGGVKFNKLTFMINSQSLIILTKSERMYLAPKVMAAFLGALIKTIQFTHYFNGGAYSNGTCYPSVTHVNGASFDMRYQNFTTNNEIPEIGDTILYRQAILNNQTVINAMTFYKFQTIYVGEKPKYANLENVTPLEDHEDHIHFGNLTPYQL